jgi:putative exporter of polyketide antibiotics
MRRRRYPVTPAEHFGVELRRRCGKCILWAIGLLISGYIGGSVLEGLKSLNQKLDAHQSASQQY